MYHIITLTPPPPNFRVITAASVSYNFFLHNKVSHTIRTERHLRLCAWYRGGKELFRIKVPSLPYDPTHLQKNRLGALPLRTLIVGGRRINGWLAVERDLKAIIRSSASLGLPLANWNKRHRTQKS